MSVVTNIIIATILSPVEEEKMEKRLKEFTDPAMEFFHVPCLSVGGSKGLEADLYVGAFNWIDKEKFLKLIQDLMFLFPQEAIQIFIKDDDDTLWSVIPAEEFSLDCFNH